MIRMIKIILFLIVLFSSMIPSYGWQSDEIVTYQDAQNFKTSGQTLSNIALSVTKTSGAFTRSAAATGTQSISIGFTPKFLVFGCVDDAIAAVNTVGFDDGVKAFVVSNNSTALGLLGALVAGPGVANLTDSIYLVSAASAGWSGHITTLSDPTIVTFSKQGAGRAMTCNYWAFK